MLSDQLSQTIAQRLVQAAISQPNPGGQIEFHDGGRGDTIVQIAQNFATTINSPTAETLTSDQQVDCLTTNYLGCLRQNIGEDPLAQHTIELEEARELAAEDFTGIRAALHQLVPQNIDALRVALKKELEPSFKKLCQDLLFSEAHPAPVRSTLLVPHLIDRAKNGDLQILQLAHETLCSQFEGIPKRTGGTVSSAEANTYVQAASELVIRFLEKQP